MTDVVITGMGAVTPLGVGARTLHERWTAGVCGVRDGEAPCADFEPTDFLSRKEARRADRCTQFAIAASEEALADAGWDGELPYDPRRIGCIIGTGIGGIGTLEHNHTLLERDGAKAVSPLAVPLMMSNAPAAAVSMRHDLRGHVYGIVSACAAGAHAIGSAVRAIQAGDAIAVVTGGAEAALTALSKAAFAALDATSTSGVSRPFDARRDGFVMGEGAGVLVLEDGDAARARGARILGDGPRLRGDLRRLPPDRPHERGEGARAAIEMRPARRRARRRATSTTSTPTAPRRRSTTGPRRRDQGRLRRLRRRPCRLLDQVGDRPPARRRRRRRGRRHAARPARPDRPADARLGGAGSRPRPRLRAWLRARRSRCPTAVARPRSRTRSASVVTTSSYVWRQHEPEARPASR